MSYKIEVVLLKNLRILWKFLLVVCMVMMGSSYSECEYKGIFNFGDSNTDTGGLNAVFPGQAPPYGMTFFKKPVGRASDGRLIVDFLAQGVGLPFLRPYLQSIGSDFRHGANFATSASTVLPPHSSYFVSGLSPFPLSVQLKQMKQFKARVDEFHRLHQGISESSECSSGTNLPEADIFGKSIYTLYIGQNDFTSKLSSDGIAGVKKYSPQIVSQIAYTIKELYALGGRTFMVLNLAPVGCYPRQLVDPPHDVTELDEFGCVGPYNEAVVEYNNLLKQTLTQTRQSLPADASLIYVDSHSALLDLFHHPTSHGLKYGNRACCGYGGGSYNVEPKIWCGNIAASACDDPYNYVSWDGVHATEAANKLITLAILNGSLFDPPFPLHQHCDLQPIG